MSSFGRLPPNPCEQKEKLSGNEQNDANNQGGFGHPIVDDIDCASLFDVTSLIADGCDDLPISRLVTDESNAIKEATEFHDTDWTQLGRTIERCTADEFKVDRNGLDNGAPSPFPHQQVESELDKSFTADDAGIIDGHSFDDQDLYGTVNQGVCEVFAQFQACGEDDYRDATIDTPGHAYEQKGNQRLPQSNAPSITLTQWIDMEKIRSRQNTKASIMRKLNVAYGIGKLLQASATLEHCTVENFAVSEGGNEAGWEVASIHVITPALSVHLVSDSARINADAPPYESRGMELQNREGIAGRNVSATVVDAQSLVQDESYNHKLDEMKSCFAFGELSHFLFSGDKAPRQDIEDDCTITDDYKDVQPTKKLSREVSLSQASINSGSNYSDTTNCQRVENASSKYRPLTYYGYPFSISQLIEHLLSCGDNIFRSDNAFKSLKEAIDEIHRLLREPIKFLFQGTQQGKLLFGPDDKLFGLSAEISKIQDAYHRAAAGRNEAVLISGVSGVGKTRLVQTTRDRIKFYGGYYVERKFDETSTQSCLSVVLSAFDDMLIQIAQLKPMEHRNIIYLNLIQEFGPNFQFLAQMLPSVLLFSPSTTNYPSSHRMESTVNIISLCFTIQRFMKVISLSTSPGMIFLDDLQWADPTSLMLVHNVLTSLEVSSLLVVGCFRSNDLHVEHVSDWLEMLSTSSTPFTTIHLEGVQEEDVNMMISEALGIVPRVCNTLSTQVYRKTKGNPYFVKEFLRTLVDQGLITYSLREKRWIYDVDIIGAQPITNNVLELITSKMNTLSEDTKMALKVASCFGIKVKSSILKAVSYTQQYSRLQAEIEDIVEEGFIDFDGVYYRFAHDKVREASYDLISSINRNQFHFEVGLAVYKGLIGHIEDETNDILYTTVEQLNYGEPALLDDKSQSISIAKLNLKAGLASMENWNFMGALTYMNAADSFLPADSWSVEYELSLNVHFQRATAAYPCGAIDVAKSALDEIDQKAKCIEDKLDAYNLLITILHHRQEDLSLALDKCINALKMLGENVPHNAEMTATTQLIQLGKTRVVSSLTSSSNMLNMQRTKSKRINDIMKFYLQLALVSYTKGSNEPGRFRGILCGYYISRWVSYILNTKVVCRYTPVALGFYSALLVHGLLQGFNESNCRESYRIGKIALKFLNDNDDLNDLPATYLVVFGYVGGLFEPIQVMVDMHRRAYEVGMQIGNISDAFFNVFFLIPRMVECGTNLDIVAQEIDFFQELAQTYHHPVLAKYMHYYQYPVVLLTGKSTSSSVISLEDDSHGHKITDSQAIHIVMLIMPTYFLGQLERVVSLAKKWRGLDSDQRDRMPMRSIIVAFYSGLSAAGMNRRRKNTNLMSDMDKSISYLAKASRLSTWNFGAMHLLLVSEKLSVTGDNKKAESTYADAIKAAETSKIVHIEGLAYELSAKHHQRRGNRDKAKDLFRQAGACYTKWGCPKKTGEMKIAAEQG